MNKVLVYVHIPKTAGTSIATVAHRLDILVKGHDIRNSEFVSLENLVKDIGNNYSFFTIVRNPWDRTLSSFLYLNKGGRNDADNRDGKKFVQRFDGNFNAFVKEAFQTDAILKQLHFMPQYKWICDKGDNLLVDEVLKFENLQAGLDSFFKRNGKNSLELPHVNKTIHEHYTKYYDETSIKIIEKIYEKDIAMFNYEFPTP
ncbi:sulfotransferase family 2 domain-containing protein [Flagellimonas meridianipacifica]|uniref:Sulfotransferase family protein n=1 Tax=Flagellimonas meridianipacifica TaxID=1080225 RepID=A0A2T0MCN6_9FLAO|nr:sulfotransferase family 2 domain-containing protein [Allomuricauda pacifica]PRX55251.1 sulfotransferase family protein [Allomuricauda pacifica]